jgi:hypothetical protein
MAIWATDNARRVFDQDLKRDWLSYSSPMMPPDAEGQHGVFTPTSPPLKIRLPQFAMEVAPFTPPFMASGGIVGG